MALLVPLKRSPEYRAIRPRVADPKPADAWQEGPLHFFVFRLRPPNGTTRGAALATVAAFAMSYEQTVPVSAVVITPGPDGENAEVVPLRQPDSSVTLRLPAKHLTAER